MLDSAYPVLCEEEIGVPKGAQRGDAGGKLVPMDLRDAATKSARSQRRPSTPRLIAGLVVFVLLLGTFVWVLAGILSAPTLGSRADLWLFAVGTGAGIFICVVALWIVVRTLFQRTR